MRADARRNRDLILETAGRLFAERGTGVGMDEIAAAADLGMGTLYRHFATKRALLAAIVGGRFRAMSGLAREAATIPDPGEAFAALVRSYLEAAEGDIAFRRALLGPSEDLAWDEIDAEKAEFAEIARPILRAAARAGAVRADLTFEDFVLLTRGVMVNMTGEDDWRRALELAMDGIGAPATLSSAR